MIVFTCQMIIFLFDQKKKRQKKKDKNLVVTNRGRFGAVQKREAVNVLREHVENNAVADMTT